MAALEIAAAHQGNDPIIIVDEVERGLEPYRQRVLIAALQKKGSQVFITTHSAAAISAASDATFWYIGMSGVIGELPDSVAVHRKRDPEAFLARITIVAEGPTEIGFVASLLKRAIGDDLTQRGIWITDGGGNDTTLQLLEALVDSGVVFAGFADNEGTAQGKWARVETRLKELLFRWSEGCLEENVIKLVPKDRLEEFIRDQNGRPGDRLRTLAVRLDIVDKDYSTINATSADLTNLIIEAATGAIPDDKKSLDKGKKKALTKHAQRWFKSVEGGRELADKVFDFDLWPHLKDQLLPFLNAVRGAISLPEITDLP